MAYGDRCRSATDTFLIQIGKKLYLEDTSKIFSFELENRELYVITSVKNFIEKLEHFYLENKSVYVDNHLLEGASLYYGDMLCDHFDEKNNMVNPISDVGWYLYNLWGFAFDSEQEKLSKIPLQTDPLTCDLEYLDIIAEEFGLKRKPCWSDAKWRAIIIHYYYNLETIEGIERILNWLYNARHREPGEEPVEITVEGQYSSFYLSDKFDQFNMCSDKFDELDDRMSSWNDQYFRVKPPFVCEDDVIRELMKIILYGVVKDDC